ncbi:MAG: DMT family transporter [Oligosphaeraceae bacterium]
MSAPSRSPALALCSVISAGILWGTISLYIRPLSRLGFTMGQVVFLRSLLALVLTGLFLLVRCPEKFRISPRDLWLFVGSGGISVCCFSWCYFHTISRGFAAVGGVLLYTSPAFVLLMSRLLFRERWTSRKLASLGLILLGCLLVSGAGFSQLALPWDVLVAGLASGFLYALYSIFATLALKKYTLPTLLFYTFLFSTLAGLFTLSPVQTSRLCLQHPQSLFWVACAGILGTALPYLLYSWGMARTTPGKAAILVAVEPAICTILGFLCYGEQATPGRLLGILAVLAAIVLLGTSQDP